MLLAAEFLLDGAEDFGIGFRKMRLEKARRLRSLLRPVRSTWGFPLSRFALDFRLWAGNPRVKPLVSRTSNYSTRLRAEHSTPSEERSPRKKRAGIAYCRDTRLGWPAEAARSLGGCGEAFHQRQAGTATRAPSTPRRDGPYRHRCAAATASVAAAPCRAARSDS